MSAYRNAPVISCTQHTCSSEEIILSGLYVVNSDRHNALESPYLMRPVPCSVTGGRQLNQKQNTAPTPGVSAASKLVAHLFIIAEYAGHQEGSL